MSSMRISLHELSSLPTPFRLSRIRINLIRADYNKQQLQLRSIVKMGQLFVSTFTDKFIFDTVYTERFCYHVCNRTIQALSVGHKCNTPRSNIRLL